MKKLVYGLVALSFAAFCLAGCLAAQQQEQFQKTLPLSSKGSFKLSNVNGEVTVSTWKEAKVEIKALKKTKKSADNLEKVKIEVSESADAVSVETVYPKHENTGVSVDYTIQVPEGVRLESVETVNGTINLRGPFSTAAVGTTNGNVHIENASGDLKFGTTNGNIEAVNVVGKVDAETTNGSITLDLSALKGDVRGETTNGGITLKLGAAAEINGYLEAETTNGSISVDFPVTLQGLEKSKHHLRGQIGTGGPRLSLETVNGSIRLTK
ncbi:MAG: hypothetical protein A2W03_09365 [Candidatus Aminicenantes bacterium RBG_16_63_16]|nr:MAG: hypothetical protein A2W03_09365 [Candidatus Aminicenantes bacterium RBG_16_63_16]